MIRVLFVCLGNICRSPMAEGIFRSLADTETFAVASAATSSWEHGNPPHPGTVEVLQRHGIETLGMHSAKISKQDFHTYDYIIAMDSSNIQDLKKMAPSGTQHKIHRFLDRVPHKEGMDVPDPWYTGNFQETESLIVEGSRYWLDYFKSSKESKEE